MKSKRSILRKSALILAFAVSAIVFLPEALFAKGAVIGYSWGLHSVSDDQLNRLTHVLAVDLYVNANGTIMPNTDDLNSNWPSVWLGGTNGLVNKAHEKGVKVSIVISEGAGYKNFSAITANNGLRATLVDNILYIMLLDASGESAVDNDMKIENNK